MRWAIWAETRGAGAIVLADSEGHHAATALPVAADRHHRGRVQGRTLTLHAAEPIVDGLPAGAGSPPGHPGQLDTPGWLARR